MKNILEFKEMAMEKFRVEKKVIPHSNPISFLYALDWQIPSGPPFSEREISEFNITLDLRGRLGRSVRAAVIAQTYFPDKVFYSGEVCEDLLRTTLISRATSVSWADETYLAEILQYESPHSVIVCEDQQFDSIFKYVFVDPGSMKHPKVIKYDLWGGLHAAYLVSEALLIDDKEEALKQLLIARSMYPNNILIKENIAGMYVSVDKMREAIEIIKQAVEIRKDAKMLWLLWMVTGEEVYRKRIADEYHPFMFNYLNKLFL